MPTDFEKLATDLLNGRNNTALDGKSKALRSLADTQDAKKIKQMLGGGDTVKKAMSSGDKGEIESIVRNILSTKEGARLAEEIAKMFQ